MNPNNPFKATRLATLATLAATAWGSAGSWAQNLNLAQSPPATVEPFVAPNVILSLDDSGSMGWRLTNNSTGTYFENPVNGTWPASASRVSILKHALRNVFNDQQLLPDGRIRLAWQVMNGNRGPTTLIGNNGMRSLDSTHRTRFLEFVRDFNVAGGTPTHALMERADTYMRGPLGIHSPWAAVPGTKAEPYLGCRRNFHILLTDGGWNGAERLTSPRNYDGANRTLPDGTPYREDNPQTRLYRDSEDFTTVADWALRSWADPLQATTRLQGSPTPSAEFRNAQAETLTSRANPAASVRLDPYWNPRYDPATWPHMVTFTIGFSDNALPSDNYRPNGTWAGPLNPTAMVPYTNDGDLADYALGTYTWRARLNDRGHDMWHAALNGRGQFYAVNRSEDLATAFRQIVQQINTTTEPGRSSAATSGSTVTRSAVGLYTAHYNPQQAWSGWITGQSVALATDGSGNTTTTAIKDWQGKSTAERLDELDDAQVLSSRTILGWNDDDAQGVPFQWSAIGATQQAHLNRTSSGTSDGHGAQRLSYLRGVRSMEGTAAPPSYPANRPFRQRHSRQGDIVNSDIWYTGAPTGLDTTQAYQSFAATHKGRTPMLYVGGNDGMLHGFSALDGSEKLAYVPRGVMPELSQLTEPGYNDRHRYFVDGSPMTGDVLDGTWKTVLVGTLGAGGKGYFVLDVTNPGSVREADARSVVLLDRSMPASEAPGGHQPADCSRLPDAQAREKCDAAKDMGHIFAAPVLDESDPQRSSQIALLNNNRWAVIMGNGYNSQSGEAVLLIQYLDGQRELQRLGTVSRRHCFIPGVAPPNCDGWRLNGLSAPRLVDINGDGRPDVVYAGDLYGNVWKFFIASEDPAKWRSAFRGSGTEGHPFFYYSMLFSDGENSITAAPTVRVNDRKQMVKNAAGQDEVLPLGGMMVAFGTGRNVTVGDPLNYIRDYFGNGPQKLRSTIYSVLDRTRYKQVQGKDGRSRVEPCLTVDDAVCKLRPDQVPQNVALYFHSLVNLSEDSSRITGQGSSTGRTFSRVGGSVDWTTLDWTRHRGWRFDLPEDGERVLKPMAFFDNSNVLAIYSQIPATSGDGYGDGMAETCEAPKPSGERQFLTLLNIMDGKPPSVQIMDANGDGIYSAADGGVNRMTTSNGAQSLIVHNDRITAKGDQDQEDVFARMPEQPARPSWRQLQ